MTAFVIQGNALHLAHDGAQIAKVRDDVFRKPVPQSEGQDSLFTFAAVTP